MNIDKHSAPIIRDDPSHWFTTLFLMLTVLVVGLSLKLHWTRPAWWPSPYVRVRSVAPPRADAAATLEAANSFVRVRDWRHALQAATLAIYAQPGLTEAYHVAGLSAGQIFGIHSTQSRYYYAKYVELEPDTRKTAFVREIFPDLIKSTPHQSQQSAPDLNAHSRSVIFKWLLVGFYFWYQKYARRKRPAHQTKV
jgi:hypothetical protein